MHLEVRFVPGVYRSDRLCSHTAVLTLGILTAHCQVSRTGPESAIYVCPSRGHTAVHPRNARDRRMYHVELTKDEFRRKPISQVITRCASSRTAVNYVKQYVLLVLCCKKQDFNPLCIYIYVRRTAVCSCGIHIQSELLSYSAGDNVFYMFTPRYSYVLVDSVRLVRTLRTYVRTYFLCTYSSCCTSAAKGRLVFMDQRTHTSFCSRRRPHAPEPRARASNFPSLHYYK